jgi:S1-C subfamily serine protease
MERTACRKATPGHDRHPRSASLADNPKSLLSLLRFASTARLLNYFYMKPRTTLLVTAAVLVGLALGATVLRGQAPVADAQNVSATQTASATQNATRPLNEGAARLQNEANTVDIVKRYEPGLVYISTEQTIQQDPFSVMMGTGAQRVEGVGSGFFVNAAGDILTNYHVVRGADKIQIRLLGNKQVYSATVIGRAPQYDLALIRPNKLPAGLVKPIPLGNSDTLAVGQKAVAMGAPFGLDFSVTEGIVSATNRRIPIGFSTAGGQQGITQNAIQTDAAINPGNSGGPLLNSTGQVIGINTQILSPASSGGEGQNAGVGFAIPINTAKNLLARLQQAGGGDVRAPIIGITPGLIALQNTQAGPQPIPLGLSALTGTARQQLGLPARGLVIARVSPNTPAARAGLAGGTSTRTFQGGQIALGGDIVTAVGGQPVDSLEDLQAGLIDRRVGDSVTLTLVRGGKTRQVKLLLDAAAFAQPKE